MTVRKPCVFRDFWISYNLLISRSSLVLLVKRAKTSRHDEIIGCPQIVDEGPTVSAHTIGAKNDTTVYVSCYLEPVVFHEHHVRRQHLVLVGELHVVSANNDTFLDSGPHIYSCFQIRALKSESIKV